MLVKCTGLDGNGHTVEVTRVRNTVCAQVFNNQSDRVAYRSVNINDRDKLHELAGFVWEYITDSPPIARYFYPFYEELLR